MASPPRISSRLSMAINQRYGERVQARRAGLAATIVVVLLGVDAPAYAADPVGVICNVVDTSAAVDSPFTPPPPQPSPETLKADPGIEGTFVQFVSEPVLGKMLRYDDIITTGQVWFFLKNGFAVGKTPIGYEAGRQVYGWKAFSNASRCWPQPTPESVMAAGPKGYNISSAWQDGRGVYYTLWNKRSGYETLLIAVTLDKAGRTKADRLATLPLKAKALSIQPLLHDETFVFVMAGSKRHDPAVYLLQLAYKPRSLP